MTYSTVITALFLTTFALACWFLWEVAIWHDRALKAETEGYDKDAAIEERDQTIRSLDADNMAMAGRIADLETELALAPAPVVSLTEDEHWASLVRESALARLREVRDDNVISIQRDGA